jgi:hypothetical protein
MALVITGRDDRRAQQLRARLLDGTSTRIMRRIGLNVLDSVTVVTSRAAPKDGQ